MRSARLRARRAGGARCANGGAQALCAGNVAYMKVSQRWRLPAKTMLVTALLSHALIPLYGMLGFIDSSIGFRYGMAQRGGDMRVHVRVRAR